MQPYVHFPAIVNRSWNQILRFMAEILEQGKYAVLMTCEQIGYTVLKLLSINDFKHHHNLKGLYG